MTIFSADAAVQRRVLLPGPGPLHLHDDFPRQESVQDPDPPNVQDPRTVQVTCRNEKAPRDACQAVQRFGRVPGHVGRGGEQDDSGAVRLLRQHHIVHDGGHVLGGEVRLWFASSLRGPKQTKRDANINFM